MAGLDKKVIFRILELVLVCILIGLHYHSFSESGQNSFMVTTGTFGGYLIILAGILFGIIIGAELDRRVSLFFSVAGFILFVVAGGLIIDHFVNYHYSGSFRNTGIAKGCVSLIEGLVFLVDAVFAFKEG